MVDRNKELAVNTAILGIGQLIPKFLAILLLPLLTSYLTTDEYGNYDLILSIASLLIPIVTMQIQQAVFRYLLASKNVEDKTFYVTSSLVYIGASSIVCYPVVYLILRLLKLDSFSALLICILFLSEALYSLLGQIVRGLGYNARYSVSVVVYSTVNLVATAVLLMGFHLGLQGVIISLTIGYLGADTYMVIASGMIGYFKLDKFSSVSLKELLHFSMPIVPSSGRHRPRRDQRSYRRCGLLRGAGGGGLYLDRGQGQPLLSGGAGRLPHPVSGHRRQGPAAEGA